MLRFLAGAGMRKGLVGGSRAWTIIGGAALGLRALRRLSAREEKVVYREELAAGQSLVLTHQPRSSRKGR